MLFVIGQSIGWVKYNEPCCFVRNVQNHRVLFTLALILTAGDIAIHEFSHGNGIKDDGRLPVIYSKELY